MIAEVEGTPGDQVTVCQDSMQPVDALAGVFVYDQEREFLGRDDTSFQVPDDGDYWVEVVMDRPGTIILSQRTEYLCSE